LFGDLDIRAGPKLFSNLRNYQAEIRYLQQFSSYRADRHTDTHLY